MGQSLLMGKAKQKIEKENKEKFEIKLERKKQDNKPETYKDGKKNREEEEREEKKKRTLETERRKKKR